MIRQNLAPLLFLLLCTGTHAQTVACHVAYGGETRTISVHQTMQPYAAPVVAVGSYFLFRLVFEETAIKTYVYADRDSGPQPLHQGIWPVPPVSGQAGFSGRHRVYEPVRDGELEYWCELR